MKSNDFISKTLKSFGYALEGIKTLFTTQRNARIHLIATIIVVLSGYFFEVNKTEWLFLTLCVILVLVAEAFNTSLEFLTDLASPEIHPIAKKVKDVAAGAVLLCAIGAIIIGIIIFWPYLQACF